MPLEESRPRYNEAIDILELAFTKDRFSYDGQYYKVNDVTVVPKPMQKPYPKFYTGGTSDVTYQMAGQKGWGIFVPPLLPWKVLEAPLNIYKRHAPSTDTTPTLFTSGLFTLMTTKRVIREEVERAILNFLAFNASPVESIQSEEKKSELRAKGYGFYASGALESLTKLTYEQIVEQEIGFIGTPEKVLHQVENFAKEESGIGELAVVSNFGGIDHWKSIKTQQMFAKHIIPAFRRKPVAAAADWRDTEGRALWPVPEDAI